MKLNEIGYVRGPNFHFTSSFIVVYVLHPVYVYMSNILFSCNNPKSKSSGGGVLAGLGARRHGVVVGGRALTPVGVLELRVVLRLRLACVHAVLLRNLVALRARIISIKRGQPLFFQISICHSGRAMRAGYHFLRRATSKSLF